MTETANLRVRTDDGDAQHPDYCTTCHGWTDHSADDHALVALRWERDDLRAGTVRVRELCERMRAWPVQTPAAVALHVLAALDGG